MLPVNAQLNIMRLSRYQSTQRGTQELVCNSADKIPFLLQFNYATEAGTGMLTLQPKFLSPILLDFHLVHFQTTAAGQSGI